MSKFFFFIPIFLSISQISCGNCTFSLKDGLYTCDLQHAFKLLEDSILTIQGSHLEGFTDSDVKVLTIRNSVIHFFRSTLPLKFPNLQKIQTFDIEIFEFSSDAFSTCDALEVLEIDDKDLETLPARLFTNCQRLKELRVSNQLKVLPNDVFYGANALEKVDLSDNFLKEIPNLDYLISLTRLVLSDNELHAFEENIFNELSFLKELELAENLLTSEKMPANLFKNLEQLEYLGLAKNVMENLKNEWFEELSELQILDLSYNILTTLAPDVFKPLQKLRTLYLDHNKITQLSSNSFGFNSNFRILTIDSNYLRKIDENFFDNFPNLVYFSATDNNCVSSFVAGANQQPIDFKDEEILKIFDKCFGQTNWMIFLWIGIGSAVVIFAVIFGIYWYLNRSDKRKFTVKS